MASSQSVSYTPSLDQMESLLMMPPDRNQILGRAAWKTRHVVCGKREATAAKYKEPLRLKSDDDMYLSIYKHKGDVDVIYQCPLSHISYCEVQMIAHRKQGPVLPTLVVTVSDKERKRRSSRAAGLMSGKEAGSSSTALWFRTTPEDRQPLLHEWNRFIMSRKIPTTSAPGPISPMSPTCPESPVSPTFVNPFNSRTEITRPPSGSAGCRMQHKGSVATQSSRERAVTYSSDSPSLRSKASDLSTPSSIVPGYGAHPFSPVSTDFPSPATTNTMDDYKTESVDGWNSKGRSSLVNSPARRRESLDQRPVLVDSSSPPIPGETILDRAFNMRMVPGSEQMIPGEEKLSSIARFEALMREAEAKRLEKEAKQKVEEESANRSALNDSSDEDDDLEELGTLTSNDTEDRGGQLPWSSGSLNQKQQRHTIISPKAQRALDFITSRHDDLDIRSPLSATFSSTALPYRPHTGYSGRRPTVSSRTQSQPHSFFVQTTSETAPLRQSAFPRQHFTSRPSTTITDRRQSETNANIMSINPPSLRSLPPSGLLPTVPVSAPATTTSIPIPATSVTADTRVMSSSPTSSINGGTSNSIKNSGFTDSGKRLSTTSSLLLVQSNVSVCNSSGSRTSTELADNHSDDEYVGHQLSHRQTLVPPPRPPRKRETVDYRSFRGVIPTDGGFF